jgi:hypothetical protein
MNFVCFCHNHQWMLYLVTLLDVMEDELLYGEHQVITTFHWPSEVSTEHHWSISFFSAYVILHVFMLSTASSISKYQIASCPDRGVIGL